MKFISVKDIEGRHHLVNPAHITVVQDADAGCVIHLRGRYLNPIVLEETTEVIQAALAALDEADARKLRRFHFGSG